MFESKCYSKDYCPIYPISLIPQANLTLVGSLWLILLSLGLFWLLFRNKKQKKTETRMDFADSVSKLFENQKSLQQDVEKLQSKFTAEMELSARHIQKVGMIRYNPFNEISGEQSFSLVFLDGHNTGVLLTSLHTRNGTRVYAKPIVNGKTKHELAKEEQKALQLALQPNAEK